MFIDARTFDGFRACLVKEFNEVWIIDLKGNARTSGERRRREGGNIFEDKIRVGVAVWFCVKKHGTHGLRIFYDAARDYAKSEEKRDFLTATALRNRRMTEIRPDAKHNWLNLTDNDFDTLIPVATKAAKAAKKPAQEKAIFKLFSLGVVTNRDEWVYDDSESELRAKVEFLIDAYNADVERLSRVKGPKQRAEMLDSAIKWTRAVKRDAANAVSYSFADGTVVRSSYRPFVQRWLYYSRKLNEMVYRTPDIFGDGTAANPCVVFTDPTAMKPWLVSSVDRLPDLHYVGAAAGTVCLPLQTIGASGKADNITDWALKQFKDHYKAEPSSGAARHLLPEGEGKTAARAKIKARAITKMDIFHYVYAVLHDPVYREKYAQNLKREFPRIPLYGNDYPDFWRWADWGRELMALHIGYETVEPWPLARTDIPDEKARKNGAAPKAMLKADKDDGRIVLDSETTLSGIPRAAWDYKLGNRSALEWILDQYKEKKPKDPTIREKFDTYRFADYKDKVIDLLARVTRVSVETQAIVEAMRAELR